METPTHKRFFSWRGFLFFLTALVTLTVLLLAEENWRGGRAWQNYKHEMEAKGDYFDMDRLISPKVPHNQNLATLAFFTTTNADAGPFTGLENQFKWPEREHLPV